MLLNVISIRYIRKIMVQKGFEERLWDLKNILKIEEV